LENLSDFTASGDEFTLRLIDAQPDLSSFHPDGLEILH